MKTVKYKIKENNANTEYREVSKEDKEWVLSQAQRISNLADDCAKSTNQDILDAGRELTKTRKELIRQGTGTLNSVKTLVDGVIKNMVQGGQRDFSDRTCKGLQGAFKIASEVFNTIEEVEWEESTTLRNDPYTMDPIQTTLSDLWDTQVYEVTVKRKR
jgi:hypothetical protein